jgi:hypothetical protein
MNGQSRMDYLETRKTLGTSHRYDVGNPGPDLGNAHTCCGVKPNACAKIQLCVYLVQIQHNGLSRDTENIRHITQNEDKQIIIC